MSLKLVTWNINSVRLRIDNVRRLIAEWAPDVLCLQETKTPDPLFPDQALAELGYHHRLVYGMKGYNGVAILSRVPLEAPETRSWCARADCRHVVAMLPGGIELHNIYVPAGGDLPDPETNPKFAHKLQFLDELTAWFAAERRGGRPMIAVGDFNVAPLEADVWSHKQLLRIVSHTPVEVERLGRLQRAGGFVDAVRHFVPAPQRLYLVELSRPRLGRVRSRPPSRSHLGHGCRCRRPLRGADPPRQPRLGQSLRSRAGHADNRGLTRR